MPLMNREATFEAREKDARYGSERLFDKMMLAIQNNCDRHRISSRPDLGLNADEVSQLCLMNCRERP